MSYIEELKEQIAQLEEQLFELKQELAEKQSYQYLEDNNVNF